MEKRIKTIFQQIDDVYSGRKIVQPEEIRYTDKNLESYQKYCRALQQEEQEKQGASVESHSIYYTLFEHFRQQERFYASLVAEKETQYFKDYEQMAVNQMTRTTKYTTKVQEEIERELQQSLYQLLNNTREKLEKYGAIEEFYQRERKSLGEVGLTDIMPLDGKAIQQETFSERNLKYRPIPEQLAINLFWINKYWKMIQDSQIGLWLVETQAQINNDTTISDKEKYFAMKRNQIIEAIQPIIEQGGEELSAVDFFRYLYGKRVLGEEFSELGELEEKVKAMSPEVKKEYEEIEREYNKWFEEGSEGGQLLTDCICSLYMIREKRNVQIIKDILTRQLIELLVLDRFSVFPKYSNWGLKTDKNAKGENQQILIMDLPGFIKPLQVHVPDRLLKDNKGEIPTYKGIYANPDEALAKASTTSFLFPLSLEQAKLVKKKMKRRKENNKKAHQKSEEPYIHMLEYMSAVSNKEMGKLSSLGIEEEER